MLLTTSFDKAAGERFVIAGGMVAVVVLTSVSTLVFSTVAIVLSSFH
jgi:hypothetical protein